MSEHPARSSTSTRWIRERGSGGTVGKWHRPAAWPTPPGDLVATMCGRDVVADSSASVAGGGVPHPACSDCAP
jgi:hypothetical protein